MRIFIRNPFIKVLVYGMIVYLAFYASVKWTYIPSKRDVSNYIQSVTDERHLPLSLIPNWMDVEQFPLDVERINSRQYVRNAEKFNFKITTESIVLLVQVHDRADMLRMQLESFRANKFINETLLVVSHDYYSKEMFDIIDEIDFCPVLQIFYPYPIQAYTNVFPGQHPNDCPRNIALEGARKRKCNNAEYPDGYKHYREAQHVQLKHHWLWKLQFVFERSFFRNVPGVTIFRLDDDYYLSPDAIHVIRKLNIAKEKNCKECAMYVMGDMDKVDSYPYPMHSGKARRLFWYAGVGRGQVFTKEFWTLLKQCKDAFCLFDDCNWDWALQHVTARCIPGGLRILKPFASRLFHLGECKGFHRDLPCTTESIKTKVDNLIKNNFHNLFPDSLDIIMSFPVRPFVDMPYGGWSDVRDHQLCFDIYSNKTLSNKDLQAIHQTVFLGITPRIHSTAFSIG